jgi:hypothetical protein
VRLAAHAGLTAKSVRLLRSNKRLERSGVCAGADFAASSAGRSAAMR